MGVVGNVDTKGRTTRWRWWCGRDGPNIFHRFGRADRSSLADDSLEASSNSALEKSAALSSSLGGKRKGAAERSLTIRRGAS